MNMFSFQDGLATNLTFRLTPNAGLVWPDDLGDQSYLMPRSLPDRNVSKDTLTDAYVDFILYCNPWFPPNVDVSQLRARFNSAPKSDNKEFETWTLLGLIKAFNAKQIDTWGQLALDLGVEPPDLTKNQSVQKVQQYTVRLKRWMRALHIDAFFEYLEGKDHPYFLEIPPVTDPYPVEGRDGVPTDEDLAIRALEPSFRPKRGRRRNSEIEAEMAGESSRAQLGAQMAFEAAPQSAFPQSAIPGSAHPMNDPWAAASAISTQFAPWQAQSAVTPSTSAMRYEPLGTPFDEAEPRSAILASGRKRRKHGPAVSSAWSASTPTGSKPRGRPPAARPGQEGPFSSFPVQGEYEASTSTFDSIPRSVEPNMDATDVTMSGMPPPSARTPLPSSAGGRGARLSLTVPHHPGGPVRLATPPRVTLRADASESNSVSQTPEPSMFPSYNRHNTSSFTSNTSELGVFTFELLKRTLASDLVRADLIGRPQRLNGDEAKRLADSMLDRMNVPRLEALDLRAAAARLTVASWLGLGDQLNIPSGPAAGSSKKIRVTRFRIDEEGYEEVIDAEEEVSVEVKQIFDVRWQASQGTCQGKFEMSGLTLSTEPRPDDSIHSIILEKILSEARNMGVAEDLGDIASRGERNLAKYMHSIRDDVGIAKDEEGVDWKAKYKMMEFGTALAHGEFDRFKAVMLQKVLDLFL